MYRSTKAGREEAEKTKLLNSSQKINPQSHLLNIQKRDKLKTILIAKFAEKYNIKNTEPFLENEISSFVQQEHITDADLQRLDKKLSQILINKKNYQNLKNTINQNFSTTKNETTLPLIKSPTSQNENFQKISINQNNNKILRPSASVEIMRGRKFIYKTPEEELKELEEEFAKEESKKKPFTKLDFSSCGEDEWMALAKYNKKLYEKQIKEEKLKDLEMKRRTKEDLDNQIKQKLKKEYEEELLKKEGDKAFQEHLKYIDEIEKKKQEELKKQILKQKLNRDMQIKDQNIRKRIETLKQKKFEKKLIDSIKEAIEKEKQDAIQKKIKENEALKKVIHENEINKQKQKELLEKEKEDDNKFYQEMERNEMKKDLERKRYFDNIRRFANKYSEEETKRILDNMKNEEKNEDKNLYNMILENNKREDEKEKQLKIKKKKDQEQLRKFLDMQIAEKNKKEEFLKALDNEQFRIWDIDSKKYKDDEKRIDKIIKNMNKRNLDTILEQMKKRKLNNKRSMSDVEFAMNSDMLQKAKNEIEAEKLNKSSS